LAFEIAARVRVDFLRKKNAGKRGGGEVEMVSLNVDPESEDPMNPPAEGPLPNEIYAQAEEAAIISAALDEVTGTEGQVLREFLNGLSQSETAAKLGLNEKTIGVYKQRGLEKLQKILKQKKMV
jgi:RNA polymerase sigma factor (sigma-70 family)